MPGGLGVGALIDGRYELVGIMGEGATATVYKARQRHIERPVAVKILRAGYVGGGEGDFEARFVREAQLSAQIRHPGVVTIHDFGFTEEGRFPYIVMELLDGHDLEHEITVLGALNPRRALGLFKDCLGALAKGHDLGIVHRDLKPANLFLSEPAQDAEQLIILDFGIAGVTGHHDGASQRLTNAGELVGTPCYLAPEYIKSQEVSPVLDVYQMGLILVEALTGHTVVDDESVYGCIQIHGSGALVIPEIVLDSALGPIIRRAVSLAPADRYPDAGSFRAALAAVDVDEVCRFFEAASNETWAPTPERLDASMDIEAHDEDVGASGVIDSSVPLSERRPLRVLVLGMLILGCVVVALWFWLRMEGGEHVDESTARASSGVVAAEGKDADSGSDVGSMHALEEPSVGDYGLVGTDVTGDDGEIAALEDGDDRDVSRDVSDEGGVVAGILSDVQRFPEDADVDSPAIPMDSVVVRLESKPSGAKVFRGNEVLGKTPLSLPLEGGLEVTLSLRKRGYYRAVVTFEPSEGLSLRRRLKKRRAKTNGGASDGDGSSMRIIP